MYCISVAFLLLELPPKTCFPMQNITMITFIMTFITYTMYEWKKTNQTFSLKLGCSETQFSKLAVYTLSMVTFHNVFTSPEIWSWRCTAILSGKGHLLLWWKCKFVLDLCKGHHSKSTGHHSSIGGLHGFFWEQTENFKLTYTKFGSAWVNSFSS